MLRVWAIEEQAKSAMAKGARFLLVCYDAWDREMGEADLGYYYPAYTTIEDVRAFLAKVRFDADAAGSGDVCEAVIDLSRMAEGFDVAICEKPADWLERMARLH